MDNFQPASNTGSAAGIHTPCCSTSHSPALPLFRLPPRPTLLLLQALMALGCMEHRGACSADGISGDGAGVMTKVPWGLFKAELSQLKVDITG